MRLSIGDEVELKIERLGIYGEGVGRFEGFTLFVDGALPGELVSARVIEKRKTFGRAQVIKRLVNSSYRVEPPCSLFGRCGGCQLMHLEYSEQLQAKRERVIDAIERIGKLHVEVLPCLPSPSFLGYRNKIQMPVDKNLELGLYARNSHQIVPVVNCKIHCSLGEKSLGQIQTLLSKSSPKKIGGLKHLLIKTAVNTQEVLVVLVTENFELLPDLAEEIFHGVKEVKGVVQSINPNLGNAVLGSEFHTLIGQSTIKERLCGLEFCISPASFFQVNPEQAELLYEKVLEYAQLEGKEVVLDAYCGVGTLSLIFAKRTASVIGIECVADAICDAQNNAKRNQIDNVTFLCGKAEEVIPTLETIDVAILNPPRKGCDPALLNTLISRRTKRILYVSCDPATLARDLQLLSEGGYQINSVQPVDMFPQTIHVECVVSLQLRMGF